jgi:hypothetical protein
VWRRAKDGTPAKSAWHFVTIDGEIAEAIHAAAQGRAAAWGSVYVSVTIGKTQWRASLFPNKNVGGDLLPVKASARKAEQLAEGDRVTLHLSR